MCCLPRESLDAHRSVGGISIAAIRNTKASIVFIYICTDISKSLPVFINFCESSRDGNFDIYVMDADGSDLTKITNMGATKIIKNSAGDYHPAWSPDGKKIAFYSDRDGGNEIYVMDADGQNQTRLTNNTATDCCPDWSPDGTKIAFQSYRDGNNEIYVMDADGKNQTRLTNNSANDSAPVWSPAGG